MKSILVNVLISDAVPDRYTFNSPSNIPCPYNLYYTSSWRTPPGGGNCQGEESSTSVIFAQVVALQLVCCQADDWGQCSRDTVTRTCSDLYHVKFAPEDDGLKNYVSSSKSNFSS